jgi:hypothetical protein
MNSGRKFGVLLLCGVVWLLAGGIQAAQDEWQLVKETRAGYLYHRESRDSSIPWIMITARFAASPERVHAIVTDRYVVQVVQAIRGRLAGDNGLKNKGRALK